MRPAFSRPTKRSPALIELPGHYVDSFFVAYRALNKIFAAEASDANVHTEHTTEGITAKKPQHPSVVAVEAEAALEQYRMAVTNLPVTAAVVDTARSVLDRVFERVLGAEHAAAVAAEMHAVIIRGGGGGGHNTPPTIPLGESSARNSSSSAVSTTDSSSNCSSSKANSSYLDKSCYVQQRMQRVVAGIFVGSYHPAADKALLQAAGITHVCCCIDVRPRFPDAFRYVTLPASDAPEYNMAQHFDQTFTFIDEAVTTGGGVLIHCGAGISRAPTILAAYLVRKLGIHAVTAVQMIRAVRSCASPNMGFMAQLERFYAAVAREEDGFGSKSAELFGAEEAKQTADVASKKLVLMLESL